nr:hypothetical protein [Megavirus caiporensis]
MNKLDILGYIFEYIDLRTQCIKLMESKFWIDNILFHCVIYCFYKYKIVIKIQIYG